MITLTFIIEGYLISRERTWFTSPGPCLAHALATIYSKTTELNLCTVARNPKAKLLKPNKLSVFSRNQSERDKSLKTTLQRHVPDDAQDRLGASSVGHGNAAEKNLADEKTDASFSHRREPLPTAWGERPWTQRPPLADSEHARGHHRARAAGVGLGCPSQAALLTLVAFATQDFFSQQPGR